MQDCILLPRQNPALTLLLQALSSAGVNPTQDVSLAEAGLDAKVAGMFRELTAGPGAVRATLKKYL